MKPNKPVKLTVNGRRQGYIDLHRTAWGRFKFKIKRFFRRVFVYSMIGLAIWVIFALGGLFNPATVYTKAEIIKEVEAKAPILDKIAKCESGDKHYDVNGQVLMRSNNNKTVDVGRFQINSVWFSKATELGLDITKEEDNRKMAEWIYKNRGTEDWKFSSKCWNK